MDIKQLHEQQQEYSSYTQSDHTRREYSRDWTKFNAWCSEAGRDPFPTSRETVSLYITDLLNQGAAITSVVRYTAAINSRHRASELPLPVDRGVWAIIKGAQRLRGEQPKGKKPLTVDQLRQAVALMEGSSALLVRNRAILTLGFASALRRSNLVALDLADVTMTDEGVFLLVRKEKQDQQAKGRTVPVARGEHADTCALTALQGWLLLRGITAGPLFTRIVHGRASKLRLGVKIVAKVVKRAVKGIGLDPAAYAGHSLRAGFVTAAFEAGAGEVIIANHTGHRSLSSLRRYLRPTDPWRANASGMIGL